MDTCLDTCMDMCIDLSERGEASPAVVLGVLEGSSPLSNTRTLSACATTHPFRCVSRYLNRVWIGKDVDGRVDRQADEHAG